MVNKLDPMIVEGVPDEQVEEIYRAWFDTCVPEQLKERFSTPNVVLSDKLAARLLVAQWGIDIARKAIAALPLSPEHDGSRHKDHEGFPLVRRDLVTARHDALELAGYWDHVK